ncbi:cell agglutination protein mam3 [Apiospora hydei]|uniref:Cell agglutination protein mam3 n=1 Tax=Apiospora hydei TaxID=1337664 RepID=A0ABR1W7Z0_9PEZI
MVSTGTTSSQVSTNSGTATVSSPSSPSSSPSSSAGVITSTASSTVTTSSQISTSSSGSSSSPNTPSTSSSIPSSSSAVGSSSTGTSTAISSSQSSVSSVTATASSSSSPTSPSTSTSSLGVTTSTASSAFTSSSQISMSSSVVSSLTFTSSTSSSVAFSAPRRQVVSLLLPCQVQYRVHPRRARRAKVRLRRVHPHRYTGLVTTTTTIPPSGTVSGTVIIQTPLPTFSCDPNGYLIQQNGSGYSLNRINIPTGNREFIKQGVGTGAAINAMGYNSLDNYLYAALGATPGNLLRIGSNGDSQTLASLGLTTAVTSGDVDENGYYWATAGGKQWWGAVHQGRGGVISDLNDRGKAGRTVISISSTSNSTILLFVVQYTLFHYSLVEKV